METRADADIAAELEAELERYPDERGEILAEAADAWRRAGEHDRAITLLTEAIDLGGEDGDGARVALADVLFDLDRVEQARAQLDTLLRRRPLSPAPYHLAAELLEARDEPQQALTWFDLAAARLTEQDLAELDTEAGLFSYANNVLVGRRRVRRALGLLPDELDESASAGSEQAFDPPPELPREVWVQFWPRGEIPGAHDAWPELVEQADAGAALAEREAANRELSEAGVARITMVPLTVARLREFATRTGGDPLDEDCRVACVNEILDQGDTLRWPPARNVPCWCGSTVKYKKCCGRPDLSR